MAIKLYKGAHSGSKYPIYILAGDTFRIKDLIKSLKFKWEGSGRFPFASPDGIFNQYWWIYQNRFTWTTANKLETAGVDVSIYKTPSETSIIIPETTSESEESLSEDQQKIVVDQSYDDASEERGRSSRWNKFPIKNNIYQTDVKANIDGTQITLHATVNRVMLKDKLGHVIRGKAGYTVDVSYNGHSVGPIRLRWGTEEDETFKQWNPQAEISLLERIPEKIQRSLNITGEHGEKTKLYNQIKAEMDIEQRDPEFKRIMDDEKNLWQKSSIFTILDGKYAGSYPILIKKQFYSPSTVEIHPHINPSEKTYLLPTLIRIETPLSIKTLQEFEDYIDNDILNHYEEIKEKLEEYLQEIAYHPEDKAYAQETLQPIIDKIINKDYSGVEVTLAKLRELGYLRHRKNIKQQEGLKPMSDEDFMFDAKKISSDRAMTEDHNYFYWNLAYLVNYWKSGNIENAMPFSEDYIRSFYKSIQKKGLPLDISFDEFYRFIRNYAGLIYQRFFSHPPPRFHYRDADYDKLFGKEERINPETGTIKSYNSNLMEFIEFASQYGIDQETAFNNIKSTYRNLAKRLHPDLSMDDEKERQKKEELMKHLTMLYENIPYQYKETQKVSWKDKFVEKFFRKYGIKQ